MGASDLMQAVNVLTDLLSISGDHAVVDTAALLLNLRSSLEGRIAPLRGAVAQCVVVLLMHA